MFNRCRRWRVLFARHSDGIISPSQRGALQDHLVSCASCRKIAEADGALQSFFDHFPSALSAEAAAAFDNRVAAIVLSGSLRSAPQPSWALRNWKWLQGRTRVLPLAFMAQIGSGAVFAVALAAFFLQPALHSHAPVSARATQLLEIQAQDRERAEASVPMESLLQTPTPRAAMLWTNPQQPISVRHKPAMPSIAAPALPVAPAPALPKRDRSDKATPPRHAAPPNTRAFG